MKNVLLSFMATIMAASLTQASVGETVNDTLRSTLHNQKVVFFAETKTVPFKKVGLPALEILRNSGFDCLTLEQRNLKLSDGSLPLGLTYENSVLLSMIGIGESTATTAKADAEFIESVKRLGYIVLNYKKESAAHEIADLIHSRQCQSVVAVIDAPSKYSLSSNSIQQSLQKSGWDTISYLLLPNGKITVLSETSR